MSKLKRVSCKVAKAIKEAGYPQEYSKNPFYTCEGLLKDITNVHLSDKIELFCSAPSYLEVWLWLWREKGLSIEVIKDSCGDCIVLYGGCLEDAKEAEDLEEAIIAAIECLAENDLIK